MATIMPQNMLVKRALDYILSERAENPDKTLSGLMDEAGMRFNLSPLEVMELQKILSQQN